MPCGGHGSGTVPPTLYRYILDLHKLSPISNGNRTKLNKYIENYARCCSVLAGRRSKQRRRWQTRSENKTTMTK